MFLCRASRLPRVFKPSGLAQVTARGLKDGAWIVPGESALHCGRALCTSPRRRGHGHGDGDWGGSPAAAVGKWGSTGFAATDPNRLDPRSLRGVAAGAYGGAGTARGANRCRGALRSALLRGCQCAATAPTRASSSGAAAHKREEDAEDTRRGSGEEQRSKEPPASPPPSPPSPAAPCPPGEAGEAGAAEGKPNKTQQLKKVFKEYGAVGVSFHVAMSLMSLGMFYLLVSSGIDMAALLCELGFSEAVVQSRMAAGTSTFVLAYAVHKLFAPVRISITLVSVPLIVRYFRKTGLFKPPRPAP